MSLHEPADVKVDWDFHVLIDDAFLKVCSDHSTTPIDNKRILSIANDFEDGVWRFQNFQQFIWDNIAETSLSQKERECLAGHPYSLLYEAAQNLRFTDKDINKGSELAEIVLYGIMKNHFDALPVVPKIFYKQNSQDNAKGADSVHIVLENGNDFSIWFGEAKFYNTIEDARLPKIVASVGESLRTGKLRKENSIITNVSDIDALVEDEELLNKVRAALSNRNSIDKLKPKLNVPILLLHQCSITSGSTEFSDEYIQQIKAHHKDRANAYFKAQIDKLANSLHKYKEIRFHIILFPVPDKQTIVDTFLSTVEHLKE